MIVSEESHQNLSDYIQLLFIKIQFDKKMDYFYRFQQAVSFLGPTIWNQLPINVRNMESLLSFKRALKSHIISTCTKEPLYQT